MLTLAAGAFCACSTAPSLSPLTQAVIASANERWQACSAVMAKYAKECEALCPVQEACVSVRVTQMPEIQALLRSFPRVPARYCACRVRRHAAQRFTGSHRERAL